MFAYIVNTDLIQKKATLLTTFLLEKMRSFRYRSIYRRRGINTSSILLFFYTSITEKIIMTLIQLYICM